MEAMSFDLEPTGMIIKVAPYSLTVRTPEEGWRTKN